VEANQFLTLDYRDAGEDRAFASPAGASIFQEVSRAKGLDYIHPESDSIDYNVQPLLLHKLSQQGPGMAVCDVNRDGLDDFYIGGSRFYKGRFFLQQPGGSFRESDLLPGEEGEDRKREEELGVLFFDADNDRDDDLYLVSGGYEFDITDSSYRDRLFLNEEGKFREAENALPDLLASGSCVKAADFDRDGDLDLFVGGRVRPAYYPLPVDSYLLINDGKGNFSIGNDTCIPGLNRIGLISDALWTDYDNDGWIDLLLAGEWMPMTLLINMAGTFERTIVIGDGEAIGWWNSLASGDFDMDGDMDYVAGNLGGNSLLRASVPYPVSLYVGDYDNNNYLDLIPTTYFTNEQDEPREFPFFGRTDMEKQLSKLRELYPEHKAFGRATIQEIMERLPDATTLLLKGNDQLTSWVENRGHGEFAVHPLPPEAQLAPVFAILTGDYTGDALPDILLTGNDYGNEIREGRYDALNGLLLEGDGQGHFLPLSMQQSGIIIPGDGKSLVQLQAPDSSLLVVSAQNRGPLGLFRSTLPYRAIALERDDCAAIVHLQGNRTYRVELHYGDSYLSQSDRRLWLPSTAQFAEVIGYKGEKRLVAMPEND
jgi:hypothetical protein